MRLTGVRTGSTEKSPARRARDRRAKTALERSWARKSGPGTTRYICSVCGGSHPLTEHPPG